MTREAKRYAIAKFMAQFRIFLIRLNMMSLQSSAYLTAFLTCILVPFKYGPAPIPVFR